MSKFNTGSARAAGRSAILTEAFPSARTYNGGAGYVRTPKSELFLLGTTNFVSEDTFYEQARRRDDRFVSLIHAVTAEDHEWVAQFLHWLRSEANIRSASLVGGAEYVKACLDLGITGSRATLPKVLRRADEPGEIIAYWTSKYGRPLPKPLKRGVADAIERLYSERSYLKYDSANAGYRFADVIELCHPDNGGTWQGDLYQHILNERHDRGAPVPLSLEMLRARKQLMAVPVRERRAYLEFPNTLSAAGMTWESLAGWLQGPMDAAAWESIIGSMGYMALLRNLRNFDEAGVSNTVATAVANKLADPIEVAKSRQFPMRFLSAYRAAPSLRWSWALEQALNYSLENIPSLPGRTLILVDTSGSMQGVFSKDGTLRRWDAAVIFGVALGSRCQNADVISFSNTYYGTAPWRRFDLKRGESLLRSIERWKNEGYFIGAGTDTLGALHNTYAGHDRVVILTDEQADRGDPGQLLPTNVPLYTWNLAGYKFGNSVAGIANRHVFAGLNDSAFKLIPLLEAGYNNAWPWERQLVEVNR